MAAKESENGVNKGFQMRKQINISKWQTFQNALYNPSTKEVLGRTGQSWGKLLLFYSIFYIVLAALFAICMQGLLATLDDREPSRKLDDSLIGTNPGLGFRPISNRTEEGSLIWYDPKNATSIAKWVAIVDEFLAPYMQDQMGKNFDACDFDKPAHENKVCQFNISAFGECSRNKSYGYSSGSPCVFLKLNKIFNWQPDYYTNYTAEMLKYYPDLAQKVEKQNGKNLVWISCQGEKPLDRENAPEFDYSPAQGFPSYYFPYKNVENYLSPLVAVQVKNPKEHIIISIECRAWAKNILYRGGDLQREGSVRFEILRD